MKSNSNSSGIKRHLSPKQQDLHSFLKANYPYLKLGDAIGTIERSIKTAAANGGIPDVDRFVEKLIEDTQFEYTEKLKGLIKNVIVEITSPEPTPGSSDTAVKDASMPQTTQLPPERNIGFAPRERWTPDAPPALLPEETTPEARIQSAVDKIIKKYPKFNLGEARTTMETLAAEWQNQKEYGRTGNQYGLDAAQNAITKQRAHLKQQLDKLDKQKNLFPKVDKDIRESVYSANASKTGAARGL